MKKSKNMLNANDKFDNMKAYLLEEAVALVKDMKYSNFDESVDLAIKLGVDPRHAEENIRVTTPLPHGTGKSVKVLVVTEGSKEKEAEEAGADFVGGKDFLTKIKNGWTDVDRIVATPDMMGELGKLGKILGPKGLMPNPKSGTVTMDVATAVKDLKAGQKLDGEGGYCARGRLISSKRSKQERILPMGYTDNATLKKDIMKDEFISLDDVEIKVPKQIIEAREYQYNLI